jgi:hypothetical protein
MWNVFDQYTQPENRLTHALVCSLAEDREKGTDPLRKINISKS